MKLVFFHEFNSEMSDLLAYYAAVCTQCVCSKAQARKQKMNDKSYRYSAVTLSFNAVEDKRRD